MAMLFVGRRAPTNITTSTERRSSPRGNRRSVLSPHPSKDPVPSPQSRSTSPDDDARKIRHSKEDDDARKIRQSQEEAQADGLPAADDVPPPHSSSIPDDAREILHSHEEEPEREQHLMLRRMATQLSMADEDWPGRNSGGGGRLKVHSIRELRVDESIRTTRKSLLKINPVAELTSHQLTPRELSNLSQ
ncbi:unnamed protein product, partial [Polarella glacialis]